MSGGSYVLAEEVIRCVWTIGDVIDIAHNMGVDPEVAIARARDWSKGITDNANQGIDEQLCNVIESNQP